MDHKKIVESVKQCNNGKEPFNYYFLKAKVESLNKLMNESCGDNHKIDDNFIVSYWLCHFVTQNWDFDFDQWLENNRQERLNKTNNYKQGSSVPIEYNNFLIINQEIKED